MWRKIDLILTVRIPHGSAQRFINVEKFVISFCFLFENRQLTAQSVCHVWTCAQIFILPSRFLLTVLPASFETLVSERNVTKQNSRPCNGIHMRSNSDPLSVSRILFEHGYLYSPLISLLRVRRPLFLLLKLSQAILAQVLVTPADLFAKNSSQFIENSRALHIYLRDSNDGENCDYEISNFFAWRGEWNNCEVNAKETGNTLRLIINFHHITQVLPRSLEQLGWAITQTLWL